MTHPIPDLSLEHALIIDGAACVGGMDEVGRGALAGPVMVGVVVVDAGVVMRNEMPLGLSDSKLLTKRRRENLCDPIKTWGVAHAVGSASPEEIDEYGIMAALQMAGERALKDLAVIPDVVILDGPYNWLGTCAQQVVSRAKADQTCASVAAASVIAKVQRDHLMVGFHEQFPHYQWASNKGYGVAVHRDAIATHGVSPLHRRSWNLTGSPVID